MNVCLSHTDRRAHTDTHTQATVNAAVPLSCLQCWQPIRAERPVDDRASVAPQRGGDVERTHVHVCMGVCARVCFKTKQNRLCSARKAQTHTGKHLSQSLASSAGGGFNLRVQGSTPCSGAELLGTAAAQSGGGWGGSYERKRFGARSTTEVPLSKIVAACALTTPLLQ